MADPFAWYEKKVRRLEKENAELAADIVDLEEIIERARTYKGHEAHPCPLCRYQDGVFIESCSMHTKIYRLEAENKRLKNRMAVLNVDDEELFELLWYGYGAADPNTLDKGANKLRDRLREIIGIDRLEESIRLRHIREEELQECKRGLQAVIAELEGTGE